MTVKGGPSTINSENGEIDISVNQTQGDGDIIINTGDGSVNFTIDSTVEGVNITSLSHQTATVILPSPQQDNLTTVIRNCNAEW